MLNYSFLNSLDFEFNVESKFSYNFYNKNESIKNDNLIDNSAINTYSSIDLDIKYRSKYDSRSSDYLGFFNNSLKSTVLNLSNTNLSLEKQSIFNKIHDQNLFLISTSSDIKEDDLEKYNERLNINRTDIENNVFNFITENKKIEINRNILEKYKNANRKNADLFYNIENSIDEFNKFFRKDVENTVGLSNTTKIFEDFNKFKVNSMSEYVKVTESFYYKNIGIYIEKYSLEEEYIKKDCKFYFIDDDNNNNLKNIIIKDSAVRYGNTYKYIVYPVYVLTIPQKDDYYLVDSFIMCDYPHFTNDIVCKEFERPASPSKIFFKYFEREKSLEINWSRPIEKQGDIKGYQIFKRDSLDEPYTLIKQIEFFDSENLSFRDVNENVSKSIIESLSFEKRKCEDKEFSTSKISIYTICSIDARGYTSNYSEQLGVYYDSFNKELIIDKVSPPGAPLHMPNILIPRKTKFFNNDDKIVNNTPYEENVSKFTLYLTPEARTLETQSETEEILLKNNYKLSIFNLSTGESYLNSIDIKNF